MPVEVYFWSSKIPVLSVKHMTLLPLYSPKFHVSEIFTKDAWLEEA